MPTGPKGEMRPTDVRPNSREHEQRTGRMGAPDQ